VRQGQRGIYQGLTFWSPNVNIFRDPRWGRGQETFGECPFLTGRLAVSFVRGLQGDDPRYLKLVATPKHYAVHSGPEALRHSFDAQVTVKDLRETYLPAFRDCVVEGRAASLMSAYNRTNGEACSASPELLERILRQEWGFAGFVVSDCWAIRDIHEHHGLAATPAESAALAVKAGCDLNCGCTYEHIPAAVEQGLLSETEVDACLVRVFRARFMLGLFDPPERSPYSAIPYEVNDCTRHQLVALQAARESLVLLENEAGLLPLRKDVSTVAVIGPNAYDHRVMLGNYHGTPSRIVTPLDGIREMIAPGSTVLYAPGCKHQGVETDGLARAGDLGEARSVAQRADVVVLCVGLSSDIEGEQGDTANSEAAGDRPDLRLPGLQQRLIDEVLALGKPTVVVLLAGSPIELDFAGRRPDAILAAWYPGQSGGTAIAEALFGEYSPAGRLPVTFPASTSHLPEFSSYGMQGRTYRYLEHVPLYPFGYGLSYTRFRYSDLELSRPRIATGESVEVSILVQNAGERASDEVVQLYVSHGAARYQVPQPHRELRGFERTYLRPGEARCVVFRLGPRELSRIDELGRRRLEPGRVRLSVGGSQPDARSVQLLGQAPLESELDLVGDSLTLPY
jgi:beta-glucosidase